MGAPKGKNIRTTFELSSKDTDASLIKNDISYTVFVLSVKEKSKTNGNVLSKAKKEITLSSEVESVVAVQDVKVAVVSNYGNGRDLQVSFSKLADEKNLAEYRVFVVRSEKAKAFELINAKDNNHYTTIAKTGANLSQTLVATAKDSDGHTIKNDVNYQVFVLTVGSVSHALSNPSSAITLLDNMTTNSVTNVTANDISNHNDGRDMQITFTKVTDETTVSEY